MAHERQEWSEHTSLNATDADAGGLAGCTGHSSGQCRLLGWQFALAPFSAVYPRNNSAKALRYLFVVSSARYTYRVHPVWAFTYVYTLAVSCLLWTPCCDIKLKISTSARNDGLCTFVTFRSQSGKKLILTFVHICVAWLKCLHWYSWNLLVSATMCRTLSALKNKF